MKASKHKIVLYNPDAVFFDMPLALLAIGSCFDNSRYDVVIIDGRIDENAHQKVLEEVKGAVCFGVTVLTGKPINDAIVITRKVKQNNPEVPTVWGGWHTSLFPERTLEEEMSIDIAVQGQGEITFQELIAAFEKNSSLDGIHGICYHSEDGEVIKNPTREMVNMDELPPANYGLIDVEKYFQKKGRRQLDYISSVGCFYRCAFCADPYVFKRKFSAISPERMSLEFARLYKKYAYEDINFQDETFFTFKDRVLLMAQELINQNINISWAATLRADQGNRLTQDDFHLLAKSGLRRVLVGVESGSQEMMDWLKKDIKKEQVISTAEKCIESNIDVQFPFIVGFPGESAEAFTKTINFAITLANKSDLFEIIIFYFKPYPGSAISRDVIKQGYLMPTSLQQWSEFDYIGSSGPWMTAEKYHDAETLKFYLKLSRSKHTLAFPLKWIAKKRLMNKRLGFPIEKSVIEKFIPQQKLS